MSEVAQERTPRDTRLRLNKMERWFRRNAERFTPGDQVFLRLAFEYAEKPADADVIADALRAGMGVQQALLHTEPVAEPTISTEGGGDPSATRGNDARRHEAAQGQKSEEAPQNPQGGRFGRRAEEAVAGDHDGRGCTPG
jgi:hypothetical protein